MKTDPQTNLTKELERITVKMFLQKAKEQAIATGDIEWLERLHNLERKHVEVKDE